jgi:hypothetical protein
MWKSAALVFHGGTQQVIALKGKRVRTRALVRANLYDPIHKTQKSIDIVPGSVGLIANPIADQILIAFAKHSSPPITNIDALKRTNDFNVAVVNWPTFRMQFEIDD